MCDERSKRGYQPPRPILQQAMPASEGIQIPPCHKTRTNVSQSCACKGVHQRNSRFVMHARKANKATRKCCSRALSWNNKSRQLRIGLATIRLFGFPCTVYGYTVRNSLGDHTLRVQRGRKGAERSAVTHGALKPLTIDGAGVPMAPRQGRWRSSLSYAFYVK